MNEFSRGELLICTFDEFSEVVDCEVMEDLLEVDRGGGMLNGILLHVKGVETFKMSSKLFEFVFTIASVFDCIVELARFRASARRAVKAEGLGAIIAGEFE